MECPEGVSMLSFAQRLRSSHWADRRRYPVSGCGEKVTCPPFCICSFARFFLDSLHRVSAGSTAPCPTASLSLSIPVSQRRARTHTHIYTPPPAALLFTSAPTQPHPHRVRNVCYVPVPNCGSKGVTYNVRCSTEGYIDCSCMYPDSQATSVSFL